MLDKYEDFFKISKSQQCYFYSGISRQTGQHVLLKRFKNAKLTWDEVLKSRSLQFSQKAKMFPKMVEIFKNKKEYYIVYEKPTGPSLANVDTIAPIGLQNFYPLLANLCSYFKQLREMNPMVWVIPEWIFLNRNTIKILHFQPFFPSKQGQNNDHVFIYKVENNLMTVHQNVNDNQSQLSVIPADKKRNLIFNLGIICYYLLTGSKRPSIANQEQYLNYAADLEANAQKRIIKITKQKALGQMVGKMFCNNVFELPDFNKISDFFQNKAAQIAPKKQSHNNIQIQLQKITLETTRREDTDIKKKLRHCCAQKQASLQRINEQNKLLKQNSSRKKTQNLRQSQVFIDNSLQKKFNTFLPSIHKQGHKRFKTSTDLMSTTNSKPLMFANRSSIIRYD